MANSPAVTVDYMFHYCMYVYFSMLQLTSIKHNYNILFKEVGMAVPKKHAKKATDDSNSKEIPTFSESPWNSILRQKKGPPLNLLPLFACFIVLTSLLPWTIYCNCVFNLSPCTVLCYSYTCVAIGHIQDWNTEGLAWYWGNSQPTNHRHRWVHAK